MALAGIAALVHDLLLTTGVYALTGFEVTPATIVALLTILGYSLYDTVVVFEKIREMAGQYGDRLTYSEVVNRSMNLVLSRSLNTSLTSLLTVGSILFVGSFVLGATTLEDFALGVVRGSGGQHLLVDLRGGSAAGRAGRRRRRPGPIVAARSRPRLRADSAAPAGPDRSGRRTDGATDGATAAPRLPRSGRPP